MRNENCNRRSTCYDYKHNHCDGCGANKPTGDLISREALREALNELFENGGYDSGLVMNTIDNAPTVEGEILTEEAYSDLCLRASKERPQGEWIVTAEDSEGIHRIQCPFCRYEKGSDFIDYIIVTFEKFPPFCESCGAELRGKEE